MPDYRVFGGRLASELVLPELHPAEAGPADWRVTVSGSEQPSADGEEIAADDLGEGVTVRLIDGSRARALAFDDTGRFDVRHDGRELRWSPSPDADVSLARTDLLGRVFALALHQAGHLVLHGSAVSIDGRAIGFLADKGSGKSTFALALVRVGARLITDDTLSIDPQTRHVVPGVQAVRLWSDAAAIVSGGSRAEESASGKLEFREFAGEELERETVPLDALYLLRRVELGAAEPVRTRLNGPTAALALLPQAKLGGLVRGQLARETLARAAALAASVPVCTLALPTGFDALPAAAAAVHRWHSG